MIDDALEFSDRPLARAGAKVGGCADEDRTQFGAAGQQVSALRRIHVVDRLTAAGRHLEHDSRIRQHAASDIGQESGDGRSQLFDERAVVDQCGRD